jgi:hypothetical protein
MDTKQIRQLLRNGSSVVLLEEGHPPLVVSELKPEPTIQEVPIASRWPKGRTIHDGPTEVPARTDHLLERLNKEILALKAEIAQQEESSGQQ